MIEPELIAPSIFRIRLGRVNSYLVRGSEGALLVDCGLPQHLPMLLRALAAQQLRACDLCALLLTHRHLDHSGSAHALQQLANLPVLIHREDAAAVAGQAPLSPPRRGLGLLSPLTSLLDNRIMGYRPCRPTPIDESWQRWGMTLLHLPGHTPGHSGFRHSSGVVFCGDAAKNSRGLLAQPSSLFTTDPAEARRSQQRLADLQAPLYCFGHGAPLTDAARLAELARS